MNLDEEQIITENSLTVKLMTLGNGLVASVTQGERTVDLCSCCTEKIKEMTKANGTVSVLLNGDNNVQLVDDDDFPSTYVAGGSSVAPSPSQEEEGELAVVFCSFTEKNYSERKTNDNTDLIILEKDTEENELRNNQHKLADEGLSGRELSIVYCSLENDGNDHSSMKDENAGDMEVDDKEKQTKKKEIRAVQEEMSIEVDNAFEGQLTPPNACRSQSPAQINISAEKDGHIKEQESLDIGHIEEQGSLDVGHIDEQGSLDILPSEEINENGEQMSLDVVTTGKNDANTLANGPESSCSMPDRIKLADEEAIMKYGVSSFEIAITTKKIDLIIKRIQQNGNRKERAIHEIDDSDEEFEAHIRSGERILRNGLRESRSRRIENSKEYEEEKVDENSLGISGSDAEDDENEETNSSRKSPTSKKNRKRKSRLRHKHQKGNELLEEDLEKAEDWLSKDSAVKKRRSFEGHIKEDEDEKTEDEPNNGDENSDSPPPKCKISSLDWKKDNEIKKLFRESQRFMESDNDDDEEEDKDEDQNTKVEEDEEKGNKSNVKRGRAQRQRSEVTRDRIDSSESDAIVSSEDEEGNNSSKKKNKKTKSASKQIPSTDGYEVLTLGKEPRKVKKKPLEKKANRKRKTTADNTITIKKKANKLILSDEEEDEEEELIDDEARGDEPIPSSDEEVPQSSQKNKVIPKKKLKQETKEAEKAERERRKRLEEKQKEFNGIVVGPQGIASGSGQILQAIVLDRDSEAENPIPVKVHNSLVRILKKHQAEGMRFLYDTTFESLSRLDAGGGGGILGHCMGLGKTLQIIAFLHTILTHPKIEKKVNRVMIVAPKNVVLNWEREMDKWLFENDPELAAFDVTQLDSFKTNELRLHAVKRWSQQKRPAILIIGYDMFRMLTKSEDDIPPTKSKKVKKKERPLSKKELKKKQGEEKMRVSFRECLYKAPHVVICDEGHKLKNWKTALFRTMNKIETKRRVCLTGTPLQNNLEEYYCMVDFVKPNLLGKFDEFKSRFVSIINRGRTKDATAYDVMCMRRRCHVLFERLKGILDRRDYTVLRDSLPPKQEYVVNVRLTQRQIELYQSYIDFCKARDENSSAGGYLDPQDGEFHSSKGIKLITDHIMMYRIWTHPYLLIEHERVEERKRIMRGEEDFVVSDEESTPHEDSGNEVEMADKGNDEQSSSKTPPRRSRRQRNEAPDEVDARPETPPELIDWAKNFVSEEDRDKFELSNKLILLQEVIKKCEAIGDKLLVFSQFLNSIALIERMLIQTAQKDQWFVDGHEALMAKEEEWSWNIGEDYDIIDGSVSSKDREKIQMRFNDPLNFRSRVLLISTKAGSLGSNLVGANRVIIFDCSWNPSHDTQALFRVYRFGQQKPVYIYRFVSQGTMEERIYNRQVTKESIAKRVTESAQVQRHYTVHELDEMYDFKPAKPIGHNDSQTAPHLDPPKDRLLGDVILKISDAIVNYHPHDVLFDELEDEKLTDQEREDAWGEYEREQNPPPPPPPPVPADSQMNNSQNPSLNMARQLLLAQIHQQQQHLPFALELQRYTQAMASLFSQSSRDPLYTLSSGIRGMTQEKAFKIFQIKQFLRYFITKVPKELTGKMNNSDAFNEYFGKMFLSALQQNEDAESVFKKAIATVKATIGLARNVPNCVVGINYIANLFPSVFADDLT